MRCTNCGEENKEGPNNLFCFKCGSKLPERDESVMICDEKTIKKSTDSSSYGLKKYIGAVLVLIISLSPFFRMFNVPEIESVAAVLGVRLSTDFSFFDAAEFLSDIKEICDDLYIRIDSSDETFIKGYMAVCAAFYAAGIVFSIVNIIILKCGGSVKTNIIAWRFTRFICIFVFIGNYLICKMIDAIREYAVDYVISYGIRIDVPASGKPFFYLIQTASVVLFLTSFIMAGKLKKQQTLNAYSP